MASRKKKTDDYASLNDKQQTSLESSGYLKLMESLEDAKAENGTNPDDDMASMDHIKDTEAEKLVCPAC